MTSLPLQEGPPTTTELHCRGREEGRRPRTRSCPAKVVGHAWLYWQPKLVVVGASKPRSFCPLSPRPRRNRHHISSKAGWRLRGCAGGVPLWLAQQHGPSQSLCWTGALCQGRVTPFRPLMRSRGTTDSRRSWVSRCADALD